MRYVELRQALKAFTVFSVNDLNKIAPAFHRRRLTEWQKKGYIRKIIKGYYIFSDLELDENRLFEIANRIYSPSYISFETALAYYGLIPETVYGITSASTRRTYKFETKTAVFFYRTLSPRFFFGYDIVKDEDKFFKLAYPEKAFLDYFYINPDIKRLEDFESLRINREAFLKRINKKRLFSFLHKFGKKTLLHRIKSFQEFIDHA